MATKKKTSDLSPFTVVSACLLSCVALFVIVTTPAGSRAAPVQSPKRVVLTSPDLTIRVASVGKSASTTTMTFDVRNLGTAPVSGFSVGFQLATAPSSTFPVESATLRNASGVLSLTSLDAQTLLYTASSTLAAKSSKSFTLRITNTLLTKKAFATLQINADPQKLITESNEANNASIIDFIRRTVK